MARVLVFKMCDNVSPQSNHEDMNIIEPPKSAHLIVYLESRRLGMIQLSNIPRTSSPEGEINSTIPLSHISAVGNMKVGGRIM